MRGILAQAFVAGAIIGIVPAQANADQVWLRCVTDDKLGGHTLLIDKQQRTLQIYSRGELGPAATWNESGNQICGHYLCVDRATNRYCEISYRWCGTCGKIEPMPLLPRQW